MSDSPLILLQERYISKRNRKIPQWLLRTENESGVPVILSFTSNDSLYYFNGRLDGDVLLNSFAEYVNKDASL